MDQPCANESTSVFESRQLGSESRQIQIRSYSHSYFTGAHSVLVGKIQYSAVQEIHREYTGDCSLRCRWLLAGFEWWKQANFHSSQNTAENCHFTGITGGRVMPDFSFFWSLTPNPDPAKKPWIRICTFNTATDAWRCRFGDQFEHQFYNQLTQLIDN